MESLPVKIQSVLNEYIALLNDRIPNILDGLYLHGSIALNAFVDDSSDIDFITVTNRPLTKVELETLSEIHEIIASKYPKIEMDGCYLLWKDIGKLNADDQMTPFYNDGNLSIGANFNFNPITWWIMKTKGIQIIGPKIDALPLNVSSQQLINYVLDNMNTYWAGRIHGMEDSIEKLHLLPTELIEEELEWSVLGMLRQYYTLKEHDIISKLGAGEYALKHVPEEWHGIIKDAVNIRKGVKEEFFDSNTDRIDSALGLMRYLLSYCNTNFS